MFMDAELKTGRQSSERNDPAATRGERGGGGRKGLDWTGQDSRPGSHDNVPDRPSTAPQTDPPPRYRHLLGAHRRPEGRGGGGEEGREGLDRTPGLGRTTTPQIDPPPRHQHLLGAHRRPWHFNIQTVTIPKGGLHGRSCHPISDISSLFQKVGCTAQVITQSGTAVHYSKRWVARQKLSPNLGRQFTIPNGGLHSTSCHPIWDGSASGLSCTRLADFLPPWLQ